MKQWQLLIGISLVTIALTVFTLVQLAGLNASVGVLVHARLIDTQTAMSRWQERDGISLSISTYRDAFESEDQFVARHQGAVLAMMKKLEAKPSSERIERR